MRITFILGSFALVTSVCAHVWAAERVLTKDVVGNRRILLDAARISERRGQNLEARFVIIERDESGGRGPQAIAPAGPGAITVSFPSHSHTTHETTLMNIITATVKWSDGKDSHEWHEPAMKPVFSAPKEAEGHINDYEKWWFVGFAPIAK